MTSESRDPVCHGQTSDAIMEEARIEGTSDKYTDDENSDAFSEFQGAILWPRRSLLYRISFLALLPLFGIFLMGFISPFWMKKHQVDKYRGYYNVREKVDVSIGLWRVCEGTDYSDITDCTVIPDTTPYFIVCQSMLCLSLIFTVFSLVFGLYENCATRYDIEDGNEVRTKRPEMNAVTAGLFGLTGVCMYGTSIIEAARKDEGAVHWAFPVTAASVTGVIVCGILMAIANPIHTATPSYPGQIMSLSRQASLRIREPSVQDRLVVTSELVAQASSSQAASVMYGVAGANCDEKDVSFLTRSESCLSSHMSSPDIYTATAMDPGLSHAYRSTHVVEPHDIHARAYDHARRQLFKQQLQNKAAQRRSWHFDDRNGAYIVTDLINNRPCASLPLHARPQRDPEEEKPPIPPRRDKLISPPASKRLLGNEAKSSAQSDTNDLMVLEDPAVTAPGKTNQNISTATRTDESSIVKRNTNPFIDDTVVNSSQMLSDLQRSTLSSSSWETQSWPDPPSEGEILGQSAPSVPSNSSTLSDKSASIAYSSQLKSVPESLQYQPQNYGNHPRKYDQQDESKIPYNTLKTNESQNKASKINQSDRSHRHKKTTGGKITPPSLEAQIPIMKEYDNPLFKAQAPDGDRPVMLGENFSLQICESTSFVHPSPEQPPPSSFYAAIGNTKSDPSSLRRHSGHFTYTPILEDGKSVDKQTSHVSHDQIRNNAPPTYSRYINIRTEDTLNKHSSPKDKSRSNSKQHQQQNGIIKSRPRQVKREHQQRRNGHPDPGNPQQYQPASPHTGRYGSSPDLVSKSPRLGRRRPDSVGPGNESVYANSDHNRNFSKTVHEHKTGTYGYDTNRQTHLPYYNIQPGLYRQWGDSDL